MVLANAAVPTLGALYPNGVLGGFCPAWSKIASHSSWVYLVVMAPTVKAGLFMNRCVTRFCSCCCYSSCDGQWLANSRGKCESAWTLFSPTTRRHHEFRHCANYIFLISHSPPGTFSQFCRQYFLVWYSCRTEGDQGPV